MKKRILGVEDEIATAEKIGYGIHYVRNIEGIPITYTMAEGGAVEDMESTTEPWAYEVCEITISADGLEQLRLSNPYQLGDVVNENVKLMDFDQIIKTYEDMMRREKRKKAWTPVR